MTVAFLVPIFLFSLCLHEFAHAWAAYRLGDSTAARLGRLTLNPIAHADLVGTVILPSICVFSGLPFFGWAKPVPVDTRAFANPRSGMALVASAGPASNIFLALLFTGLLAAFSRTDWQWGNVQVSSGIQVLCALAIQVNLFLAVFNLLPLPPLDGYNVVQAVLPSSVVGVLERLAPFTGILLLGLLLTGGFRIISTPVMHLFRTLVGWAI